MLPAIMAVILLLGLVLIILSTHRIVVDGFDADSIFVLIAGVFLTSFSGYVLSL